jgi:hypothetical protein
VKDETGRVIEEGGLVGDETDREAMGEAELSRVGW